MSNKSVNSQEDWRVKTLSQLRSLIKQAAPDAVEETKFKKPSNPSGIPVWYHNGAIICTGETYKKAVKLTFPKGAQMKDPNKLFNASLDAKAWRAIDVHEGDRIDKEAFRALIREAVELNATK